MKEKKTKTKQQLEMEKLQTRLDATERRLQEANEILQAQIAERKRGEQTVEIAQKYAESIVETIREPLLVLASDLRVLSANRSFYDTFKVTLKETTGNLIYNLGNGQWDIPGLRTLLEAILTKNNKFDNYEVEHVFSNIGHKIMLLNARRIVQKEIGSQMILLAIEDITERRQLKSLLEANEAKYRELVQNANSIILKMDPEGKVTFFNEFAQVFFGYSEEEMLGRSVVGTIVPQTGSSGLAPDFMIKDIGMNPEKFITHENENMRRNGERVWVAWTNKAIRDGSGKVIEILCIGNDITERRRLEILLSESEERYRRLFETANDGILLLEKSEGNITHANPAVTAMLGYSKEECIGNKLQDIGFSHDMGNFHEIMHTLDRSGIIYYDGVPIKTKAGETSYVDIYMVDRARLVQCNIRDISERKQAEETLRDREKFFRELYDDAPVGYHELDSEGRITRVNRTDLEMLGYTTEEMIGQYVWKFNVEEEIAREQILAKLAGTLPPARNLERTYRRKDGTTLPVLVEDRLILNKTGQIIGIRATIQDITERKQAEEKMALLQEQFRQSQKLESIGSLAGGIAHDFNNLLTVIKGYSRLTLAELDERDPLAENLKEIQDASNRASDLTRQLLAFSRRQVLEPRVLDLNQLIHRLEKMLHRMIGEDIELSIHPGENLGMIKTDPGQMEQVIFNLAVNSRDAMPVGGKLILETENVYLDEEYARNHVSVKPGNYVRLSVSDTGCGMTQEVKNRVFEPFFTTKEKDKGTGLGLSTVYGIVKQSGGNIWVYSEPGKGTTFKIYIPTVDELAEGLEEKEYLEAIPRGSETVLVVEDEEAVRRLAVQLLKRQGYKVLEATNGGEAFLICEQYKEPIHLIMSDVVMPGIGGPKLVERCRQVRKDFKVLYMSGYTDEAVVHHGVREGEMEFIQKPFSLESLARKIREVLDKVRGLY